MLINYSEKIGHLVPLLVEGKLVSEPSDDIIQLNALNPTTVNTTTRLIRHFIVGPAKLLSILRILRWLIRQHG